VPRLCGFYLGICLLRLLLLLLQSALQPLVGFGLLYDFVLQSSIFTLCSFSLSSPLNPLLLGQAISVLVFLLVLMSMVPIQLLFLTILVSILITSAAHHNLCDFVNLTIFFFN
jgi:hypothetical protein